MAKKKKQINVGGDTKLRPTSIAVIFTAINVVFGVVGFQLLWGLNATAWLVALLSVVFGLVGLIEVGLKRFTSLSQLKKTTPVEWTAVFFVGLVFVFSIVNLLGFEITALTQIVGTLFVGTAIITTFDIWV